MGIRHIYEHKYKLLMLIPLLMLLASAGMLFMQYQETGSFVKKDISLAGGTSITLSTPLENINIPYEGEYNVKTLSGAGEDVGVVIEFASTDQAVIEEVQTYLISTHNLEENQLTVETVGSSLGESFFQETVRAMLFAFILMGIVVFFYFRTVIPSLAVILAAVSDIIITVAIMDVLGIKLSSAGIAALLMLIGYSVDTDILLSTKVLKKKEGTAQERIYEAMRTGLMMTGTTLIAVTVAFFFTQSAIISQIMLILIIGLLVDIINTWLQNVGILQWYIHSSKTRAS